jgi:hypothetical protein
MKMTGMIKVITHVFLIFDSLRILREVSLINSAICDADMKTQDPKRVLNNNNNI